MIQYLNDLINYVLTNLDKEFKNLFENCSIFSIWYINIFPQIYAACGSREKRWTLFHTTPCAACTCKHFKTVMYITFNSKVDFVDAKFAFLNYVSWKWCLAKVPSQILIISILSVAGCTEDYQICTFSTGYLFKDFYVKHFKRTSASGPLAHYNDFCIILLKHWYKRVKI